MRAAAVYFFACCSLLIYQITCIALDVLRLPDYVEKSQTNEASFLYILYLEIKKANCKNKFYSYKRYKLLY